MKTGVIALAAFGAVAASPARKLDKRTFNFDICLPSIDCGFQGLEVFYNTPYYSGSETLSQCASKCIADINCGMYAVASSVCRLYTLGPLLGAIHWPTGALKFYDECCPPPPAPTSSTTTVSHPASTSATSTTKVASSTLMTTTSKPTTTILPTTTLPASTSTSLAPVITTTSSKVSSIPVPYTTNSTTSFQSTLSTTTVKTSTVNTTTVYTTPATTTTTTTPMPVTTTTIRTTSLNSTTIYTAPATTSTTTATTTVLPTANTTATSTSVFTATSTPTQYCNANGWDKSTPPSDWFDGTGSYASFSSCQALCATKNSLSFAINTSACMCYITRVDGNFTPDPTSPNVFYDMSCSAPTTTVHSSTTLASAASTTT